MCKAQKAHWIARLIKAVHWWSIGKYAYYLRKVLVCGQNFKGPLNMQIDDAVLTMALPLNVTTDHYSFCLFAHPRLKSKQSVMLIFTLASDLGAVDFSPMLFDKACRSCNRLKADLTSLFPMQWIRKMNNP